MSQLEDQLLRQIEAKNLPAPVREYRFHDTRMWRADFAWPALRILVEVEGGEFGYGRHTRGLGFSSDCEKYNQAALDGWLLLRFTGAMVRDHRAINLIEQVLKERG